MVRSHLGELIVERLNPDSDLLMEIKTIARDNNIRCGVILSLVGSLKKGRMRRVFDPKTQHMAYDMGTGNKLRDCRVYDIIEIDGPLEIVSSNGTLSENGGMHIHLVLSNGETLSAGHLIEGNLVYTTVEVVLLTMSEIGSRRIFDPETGHKELVLSTRGV